MSKKEWSKNIKSHSLISVIIAPCCFWHKGKANCISCCITKHIQNVPLLKQMLHHFLRRGFQTSSAISCDRDAWRVYIHIEQRGTAREFLKGWRKYAGKNDWNKKLMNKYMVLGYKVSHREYALCMQRLIVTHHWAH